MLNVILKSSCNSLPLALALGLGILSTVVQAQTTVAQDDVLPPEAENSHLIGQKNKQFSQDRLTVKAGDQVTFSNQDPFFHNIFSLSDAATFDLGSYPKGQSRTITLDNPGEVEVECAIHPSMFMTIEVTE